MSKFLSKYMVTVAISTACILASGSVLAQSQNNSYRYNPNAASGIPSELQKARTSLAALFPYNANLFARSRVGAVPSMKGDQFFTPPAIIPGQLPAQQPTQTPEQAPTGFGNGTNGNSQDDFGIKY